MKSKAKATKVVKPEPKAQEKIEKIFQKYKDPSMDIIAGEGIVKFCKDLGIEVQNPIVLVISYLMEAKQMGRYEKDEFINGWDSIDAIKKQVKTFQTYFTDPIKFSKIYAFTFDYGKLDQRRKGLPFALAQSLWEIFFKKQFPLWKKWNDYLNQLPKQLDITKDQWIMLYEFIKTVNEDLSNFQENGAWPLIIDEFVEYMKSH